MEHRSAAAPDPLRLRLLTEPNVHLAPVQKSECEIASDKKALDIRILNLFRDNQNTPISRSAIRQQLKINNQRLGNALAELEKSGRITFGKGGYALKTVLSHIRPSRAEFPVDLELASC
jgi:hypothetical protein